MEENTKPLPIIVGVDGSAHSIAALRRAAEIATALGVPLQAITTWEYPIIFETYYPIDFGSPQTDAEKILADAITEAFPDTAPAGLTKLVLQGPAARVLIEQSDHASMLVLGSRGHGGFAGLLLGSVSAACAAHAHCPVLIMHSPKTNDGGVGT